MLGYVYDVTKQVSSFAIKVRNGVVQAKDFVECKFDQVSSPYGITSDSVYRIFALKGDTALKIKVYGEEFTGFFWVSGVLNQSMTFKSQATVEDKKLDQALSFLQKELALLESLKDFLQNKNKDRILEVKPDNLSQISSKVEKISKAFRARHDVTMLARKYVSAQEVVAAALAVEDVFDHKKSPYLTIPAAAYSIFKASRSAVNMLTGKEIKNKIDTLEGLARRYLEAQVQIKQLDPRIRKKLIDGALAAKMLARMRRSKKLRRVSSRSRSGKKRRVTRGR